MNEFYVNNRQVIKNLGINTGTTQTPVFTNLCVANEIAIGTEEEVKTWYNFCDAIQRSLITGAALNLDTQVKLDINNGAIQSIIEKIHTLIASGEVAQFNNQLVQFDLLSGVSGSTLEYTRYNVNATLEFSDLGGAAEDEGSFALNIHINGAGTVVSA